MQNKVMAFLSSSILCVAAFAPLEGCIKEPDPMTVDEHIVAMKKCEAAGYSYTIYTYALSGGVAGVVCDPKPKE